jgi:outer membrane protein assembly factor BamA
MPSKYGRAHTQPLAGQPRRGNWLRSGLSLLAAVWLAMLVAAQTPMPTAFRLAKVDFEGLARISQERAVELSGLTLGQSLKLEDLNAAADKLYASGQFARVSYRYSWKGEQLEVTFLVEEAKPATPAPAPPPKVAKPVVWGKIEFQGLQRCDLATAVKAAGLKAETPFEQGQLNIAAKRLLSTGFFAEITYSFNQEEERVHALFTVVEAKWDGHCVFDNFIWFTRQEIYDAIRQEIPWFDGTAPDNPALINLLTGILDRLLQQRGIPRNTDYAVNAGDLLENPKRDHLFLAAGPPLPVCRLRFPGATPALEKQLQASAKIMLGTDYSSYQLKHFAERALAPLYRQKGYLRATFADIAAQLDHGANKKCPGGVNVSLPITEGVSYKLGTFDWSGNQAIGNVALQDLFGMKKGATADGAKIDKGLAAIKEEYWEKGYLDLQLTVKTDFDESAKIVNYQITVTEGPPYRMGELVIANASENEQKRLRGKWQLPPGAVFNLAYAREFVKKTFDDRRVRMPRIQIRKDPVKRTADLLFTY